MEPTIFNVISINAIIFLGFFIFITRVDISYLKKDLDYEIEKREKLEKKILDLELDIIRKGGK